MGIRYSVDKEKLLLDLALPSCPLASKEWEPALEIVVIFTSVDGTPAAMDRAAALVDGLNAHISLVDVQAVPYPLPLENPPVSIQFSKQRLLEIADVSPTGTTVHLYLCRSRLETLASVLKPGSVIIMAARKRWWPTWEKRLARWLHALATKSFCSKWTVLGLLLLGIGPVGAEPHRAEAVSASGFQLFAHGGTTPVIRA